MHPEDGPARSQREVLLQLLLRMDRGTRFVDMSLDSAVHPVAKSAWTKRRPWAAELREQQQQHGAGDGAFEPLSAPPPAQIRDLGAYPIRSDDEFMTMVAATMDSGKLFRIAAQLNCRGFLPNLQQHRMFGVSVLHMALKIRSLNTESRAFGWRDFFSMASRLRQVSEPNDAVWWIDGLPRRAFQEGFGLETPLVAGQLKVVRYYPYFNKALETLKSILIPSGRDGGAPVSPRECGFCYSARGDVLVTSGPVADLVRHAESLEEVWSAVGQDFYVVVPCRSVYQSKVMEGTRLTLVASQPDSFHFTIRMPGTPQRWADFEPCMDAAFQEALAAVHAYIHSDSKSELIEVVKLASLRLYYYWVVLAPLTRGSAMCGLAALHAVLLAAGLAPIAAAPEGMQLDWEAILAREIALFEHTGTQVYLANRFAPVEDLSCASAGAQALQSIFADPGAYLSFLDSLSVAEMMYMISRV
jgi:hypothetical protein